MGETYIILESYDDTTGEFILYDKIGGKKLFCGRVKSRKMRAAITYAVRNAESLAKYHAINKCIQSLELIYDK